MRTGEVEGDGGREDAIQMEGREKTSQRSNIAEGMTQGFIQWHRLRKLQPVLKQYNFYLYYLDFSCSFPHRKVDIVISQGLGSPVFDKLEAELAKAAMSLPATKGFQFGSGFAGTKTCLFIHLSAFVYDFD